MTLNPQTIVSVFEQCAGLEGAELQDCLTHQCGDNAELRTEVELLVYADMKNHMDPAFLSPGHTTAPQQVVQPGDKVGPYLISRFLGTGSFGEVYLATTEVQRNVAIKFLRPEVTDPRTLSRFRLEALALEKVAHSNVARFIGTGTHNSHPFLVTEYVDGEPLSNKSKTIKRISLHERMNWLLQACRGVAAIHERLLLHRDLKPANLLVRNDGTVVITDFGLVKRLQADADHTMVTMTGDVLGTPRYMAPEQLRNDDSLVLATDVYGLGAIMYFLLTGKPPVDGASFIEIADNIRTQQIASPSKIDPETDKDLSTICLRCLSKTTDGRYASVPELIADLMNWSNGMPIRARKVSAVENAVYWFRRNRQTGILSIALLIALLAGLVTTSFLWNRAQNSSDELSQLLNELAVVEKKTAGSGGDLRFRKDVMESLARGYDSLARQDAESRKTAAVAWMNLGRLQSSLGNKDESLKSNKVATERFLDLARDFPDKVEYLYDVFHCLHDRRERLQALEIMTRIIDLEPDNEYYRDAWSHAKWRYANSIRNKFPDKALQLYSEAEAISEALVLTCQTDRLALFKKKLGQIHNDRGYVLLSIGRADAGAKELEQSVAELESLGRDLPNDFGITEMLIRSSLTLSSLAFLDDDLPESLRLSESAGRQSTDVLELRPHDPHAHIIRFRALVHHAFLLSRMNDSGLRLSHQSQIEQHFDRWKKIDVAPEKRMLHESLFMMEFDANLNPDPETALLFFAKSNSERHRLQNMKVAIYQRDFELARQTLNSMTQSFFSYYEPFIDAAENGRPLPLSSFRRPTKEQQVIAVGFRFTLNRVTAFENLEHELRAFGFSEFE